MSVVSLHSNNGLSPATQDPLELDHTLITLYKTMSCTGAIVLEAATLSESKASGKAWTKWGCNRQEGSKSI